MALKPTIYKAQVELADSDRDCFESQALTIALHPSETLERMSTRLLAYCLNAQRGLEFTRGLSTTDEPEIWRHSDSGELDLWVEIGQPEEARLRKACGKAGAVKVYAFGKSSDTWWQLNGDAIRQLPRLEVWRLGWEDVQALAGLLDRTMQLSVSVVGGVVYVDNGTGSVSLEPVKLA